MENTFKDDEGEYIMIMGNKIRVAFPEPDELDKFDDPIVEPKVIEKPTSNKEYSDKMKQYLKDRQ
jgi:hypothetical protein